METMNISLPEPLKQFVDHQVAQGGYSTASEYVRSHSRGPETQSPRQTGSLTAGRPREWRSQRVNGSRLGGHSPPGAGASYATERHPMKDRVIWRPRAQQDLIDYALSRRDQPRDGRSVLGSSRSSQPTIAHLPCPRQSSSISPSSLGRCSGVAHQGI
jgi:Arc/MetJ-type ribon-helix-helix transcriptional regulator